MQIAILKHLNMVQNTEIIAVNIFKGYGLSIRFCYSSLDGKGEVPERALRGVKINFYQCKGIYNHGSYEPSVFKASYWEHL